MAARIVLPLVLVVGLVLCWALWVRAPASAERDEVAAIQRSAEAEILARLARIEAALGDRDDARLAAAPGPSALAAPSPVETRRAEEASLPSTPAVDLAPLEAEVAALARAVEAFQLVAQSGETPAKFPSLALLRGAPEANWDQLGLLVELGRAQRNEDLNARVHWLSQEEVLTTYGRPDRIFPDGTWFYGQGDNVPGHTRNTVRFKFTSDYVLEVGTNYAR
jgi:hypothetical protein